ncbi:hypothetical protein CkaCkLH20_03883 [Colletotrichum karsti]|uniref:Uncharacterized protein n=1 Tax=Colletotrichum karsti TaxID=1095194 RepID=A0A9P6ID71_9PEZI|nr:uncharacterized protein CkaCkLH20_03883 [Colletotrichum karsti]KAF9878391.1 hypothetical protein CkaCkLH20_03883 [Colletotrichum karsti]
MWLLKVVTIATAVAAGLQIEPPSHGASRSGGNVVGSTNINGGTNATTSTSASSTASAANDFNDNNIIVKSATTAPAAIYNASDNDLSSCEDDIFGTTSASTSSGNINSASTTDHCSAACLFTFKPSTTNDSSSSFFGTANSSSCCDDQCGSRTTPTAASFPRRIYRANAKRGHKFLLSDLMFDFCMVRNVTCIMRIIWAFEKARVVILIALIVQFGGAVVIMVVNIFFAQRIIRSIHPNFGWHPFFGVATLFFIFSVPAVILNNSTALGVSFYHIEDQDRVDTALNVLKAGVSWIMLLAVLPVVSVLFASIIPGPKPERFGVGDTHQKIAVLLTGAILLIAGHAVRLSSTLNPEPPDSQNKLLSKEVFYTTGFMLEIFVVVFYAVIRIDLLFHVPNGSSQPGDYSRKPKPGEDDYEAALLTKEEIEDEIAAMGHPYEIVDSSGLGRDGSGRTIVAFSTRRMNGEKPVVLPPRPQAYSRVQSIRGSVRSVRGSLRSARGGISRMMSGRMTPAPYLNQVDVSQPAFNDNAFGTSRHSQYGVAQPLFIQSRFSRYTDPDDERSALRPDINRPDSHRPESQATSGEIPLSLDREGLGYDDGRRMRRSSIQKFNVLEREGGPLK